MDLRRVEDLLTQIENAAVQIEGHDPSLEAFAGRLRRSAAEIRREILPPPEDNQPRTRDQISPREWAEYEWHDVTAFGDTQRKYLRGLKR